MALWDETPCGPVDRCQCFKGTYCFHLQGTILNSADGGSKFLWNIGACLPTKLHGITSKKNVIFTYSWSEHYLLWFLCCQDRWSSNWNVNWNFPAFYGTRRFITAFTRALYRSLSWARSIQSISSHPTSLRSILILSNLLTTHIN
jgi:hypothetical protein